jgi:predicted nucleic acid-binding protein
VIEVGPKEMDTACDLLEATPQLPPRDAVHAATMLTHRMTTIITVDAHFENLPQLRRVAPADA